MGRHAQTLIDLNELANGRYVRLDARRRRVRRVARSRPLRPKAIEREYRRRLLARVKAIRSAVLAALDPVLKRLGPGIDERAARRDTRPGRRRRRDTQASDTNDLVRVVRKVRREFVQEHPIPEAYVGEVGGRVAGLSETTVQKQVAEVALVGIVRPDTPQALIDGWTSRNVGLIKSIDRRHFKDLEKAVKDTVGSGKPTKAFRRELQKRYGVSQSRASLIARDQIGKLTGQLAEHHQTRLGVSKYVWSTSGDERVREEHEALEGDVFAWNAPPPGIGHPGEDFQCRCVALAIMDPGDEIDVLRNSVNVQKAERRRLQSVVRSSLPRKVKAAARRKLAVRGPLPIPANYDRALQDAIKLERTRRAKRYKPGWTLHRMRETHGEDLLAEPWMGSYLDVARKWVSLHG